MRFSERYGYKPLHEVFQKDTISDELKTRIWSLIYSSFFKLYVENKQYSSEYSYVIEDIWSNHCKLPLDEISAHGRVRHNRIENIKTIKNNIFKKTGSVYMSY